MRMIYIVFVSYILTDISLKHFLSIKQVLNIIKILTRSLTQMPGQTDWNTGLFLIIENNISVVYQIENKCFNWINWLR